MKNLPLKIGGRQGVGSVLAEGIKPASQELNMVDDAVHVKGMELVGYDPGVLKEIGLAFAVRERE